MTAPYWTDGTTYLYCGDEKGYRRHLRLGERACEACRSGHATYERTRDDRAAVLDGLPRCARAGGAVVNRPVAIVFIDPWDCLLLAVTVALLLVSVYSLWRRTAEARLMAALENQLADICERAGYDGEAANHRGRARKWRRLAWPRRVPPAKTAGETS